MSAKEIHLDDSARRAFLTGVERRSKFRILLSAPLPSANFASAIAQAAPLPWPRSCTLNVTSRLTIIQ
jgi:hypothetical protein